jgi:hypothetical protein
MMLAVCRQSTIAPKAFSEGKLSVNFFSGRSLSVHLEYNTLSSGEKVDSIMVVLLW